MQETLYDHSTSISIGGRLVCDLCFADDIDLMKSSRKDLANKLIERARFRTRITTATAGDSQTKIKALQIAARLHPPLLV